MSRYITINNFWMSIGYGDIAEKVERAEADIKDARDRLLALAAASPHPVHNDVDWTDYVKWRVDEAVEEIETATMIVAVGRHALEHPDDVEVE